jgi:hypothetical protein
MCRLCGDNERKKTLACGRCGIARYCGVGHQREDWPDHKLICRPSKKPATSKDDDEEDRPVKCLSSDMSATAGGESGGTEEKREAAAGGLAGPAITATTTRTVPSPPRHAAGSMAAQTTSPLMDERVRRALERQITDGYYAELERMWRAHLPHCYYPVVNCHVHLRHGAAQLRVNNGCPMNHLTPEMQHRVCDPASDACTLNPTSPAYMEWQRLCAGGVYAGDSALPIPLREEKSAYPSS